MSNNKLVMPVLKPLDWIGRERSICQSLLPIEDLSGMPWLAFGYDRPHTFEFITKHSPDQAVSPDQINLLKQAALRNLRTRSVSWKVETLELGGRKKLRVLVCDDDFLAAERIIDPKFMQKAHKRLQTKRLAVGVPHRGFIIVTNALQSKKILARFAAGVATQYHQAQSAPISPMTFLVENGEIIGLIQGMEDAGSDQLVDEATEDSKPYVSVMLTKDNETDVEALYILAVGPDMAELGQAVIVAFVQSVQKLQDHDQFGGEVKVILVSPITPRTATLDEEVAHLETHIQGVASEIPLKLTNGAPLKISVEYGTQEMEDLVLQAKREEAAHN